MRFDVLTLFPAIFQGYFTQSILKLALDAGLVEIHLWNIRDWAKGKHKKVDDRPFGGGPGMVIMPDPVFDAVAAVQKEAARTGPADHADAGRRALDPSRGPRAWRAIRGTCFCAAAMRVLTNAYAKD